MSSPNGDSNHVAPREVSEMTDREILEEMLTHMRATAQLVGGAIAQFQSNPVMKQMSRMMGGR